MMTKWDLISITLDQLVSQWKRDPKSHEHYELTEVSAGVNSVDITIKWDPKMKGYAPEQSQTHIPKAINLSLRKTGTFSGLFSCSIIDTSSSLPTPRASKEIVSEHRQLASFTKMHRNFRFLQEEIHRYKRMKENNSFLEDLMKVFPRSFDGALLGDEYDE